MNFRLIHPCINYTVTPQSFLSFTTRVLRDLPPFSGREACSIPGTSALLRASRPLFFPLAFERAIGLSASCPLPLTGASSGLTGCPSRAPVGVLFARDSSHW